MVDFCQAARKRGLKPVIGCDVWIANDAERDKPYRLSGGPVGWAIRKDSPKLQEILYEFYANFIRKRNLLDARKKQYFSRARPVTDPTGSADWKRFE